MHCDFIEQALPQIQSLQPYQPGKPIEELARKQCLAVGDIVKLASNENPLGPPASAVAAMQSAFSELARYPDANGFYLKQALAEKYNVLSEQITLGNGSNDILVLLAESYLGAGTSAVYSEYAFFVYSLMTRAAGAVGIEVPSVNWGHDLDGLSDAVRRDTKMVFLANPNNPTGTGFNEAALLAFLEKVPANVLIVLDEAYVEYGDPNNLCRSIELIQAFPNLIVTRTFSKAYGLAGCRLGYCVSHPEVADILNRLRQPFNVNSLAQVAAVAALNDDEYLERSRRINDEGLAQMKAGLASLGLTVIPSQGNFICVDMAQEAAKVYQRLLAQGVIVRPLGNYKMPEHLRLSIGLPEENQRCLDVLARVL